MKSLLQAVVLIGVLAGASSLASCNTVQGAGKDIQSGGREIQKCADPNDPTCKP